MSSRFSEATFKFLTRASKQKNASWLDKNKDEYQDVILGPMKALNDHVSSVLGLDFPAYRFPQRNIGNIKRPSNKAKANGPFKDFLTLQVSRDSGSMFEDLPGLYFMISPREGAFSAGGLYMASNRQVKRIRSWIDQDPSALERLLKDKTFGKLFKDLGDEQKLKTKPRDYPIDHPRIEWLKLTGFYVWRPIKNKELFSKNFANTLAHDWREALRFNAVLDDWLERSPHEDRPMGMHGRPEFDF